MYEILGQDFSFLRELVGISLLPFKISLIIFFSVHVDILPGYPKKNSYIFQRLYNLLLLLLFIIVTGLLVLNS